MGRPTPSGGAPLPSQRKDARAKRAKQTVNKDIPALLHAYSRARKGVEASELTVDPPLVPVDEKHVLKEGKAANDKNVMPLAGEDTKHAPAISIDGWKSPHKSSGIRLRVADTLEAAADLNRTSKSQLFKSSRTAILNMASPLRPGGGFLNGATSQEESLCMRTTLYPALREEYYRLPEIGAIYTPDVLVFRSHDADATDLPKHERFFVDVITAAMHRMPEVEEDEEGVKRYANDKDLAAAETKMRAVMRIARSKGVNKLVLGAWGCGAYGNPVGEIAAAWRRVLLVDEKGSPKARTKKSVPSVELGDGIEVVFAIKDRKTAEQFAIHFGDYLVGHLDTTN